MEDLEFSEKVSLALVLGLNADLKSAPSAAGNLRNKFAHRLDMEVLQEDVKNLTATLTPTAKQKFQYLLREGLAVTAELPKLPHEAMSFFRTQIQLSCFFVQLLREVAEERHRVAFEKLQAGFPARQPSGTPPFGDGCHAFPA